MRLVFAALLALVAFVAGLAIGRHEGRQDVGLHYGNDQPRKIVPPPGLATADIDPPCASTIDREIDSPTPIP